MQSETVLDASVVINVLWCGEPEIVLRALPELLIVPDVTSREVLRDPRDPSRPSDPIARLAAAGLVELRRLTEVSLPTFMDLVGADPPNDLGDGESAAIALAVEHGATVALDDSKARRIVRERFPTVPVISSVDLFARSEVAAALGSHLPDAVFAALIQARMRVLPEAEPWVVSLIGDERAAQCPGLRRRRP